MKQTMLMTRRPVLPDEILAAGWARLKHTRLVHTAIWSQLETIENVEVRGKPRKSLPTSPSFPEQIDLSWPPRLRIWGWGFRISPGAPFPPENSTTERTPPELFPIAFP